MKGTKIVAALALALAAGAATADQYVQGHFRSNGTYVEGYNRSSPDSVRYNNYGSQGNYNPYTGQQGTQRNEFSSPPAYNSTYGSGSSGSSRKKSNNCLYCTDD